MEIRYSAHKLDENIFDKNKIIGYVDRTGGYLENHLSDLQSVKITWNTTVGFFLKFKIDRKKKELFNDIKNELGITKEFENKKIKNLSSSELIKLQVLYIFLSDAKTIILDNIDKYLTYRDINNIMLVLRDHITELKKTIIYNTNKIDNMVLNGKRFIVAENNEIVYYGDGYRDFPEMYSIKEFVDLANKKGAKLNYYKDDGDLLKAIFRSINEI